MTAAVSTPVLSMTVQRRRRGRDHHPSRRSPSERVRGKMGTFRPSRAAGPHHHLERTPTTCPARRVRSALQRASPAPFPRTTSTSVRRRCGDWFGRAGPATLHLRRTHQRVPHRSLTTATTAKRRGTPVVGAPNRSDACIAVEVPRRTSRADAFLAPSRGQVS